MANKTRETANLVSSKTGIAVTISGDPVVLGVGNTESVRISSSGKVGIATTNPSAFLHIGSLLLPTTGDGNQNVVRVERHDQVLIYGIDYDAQSNDVVFKSNNKDFVFRNGLSEAENFIIEAGGSVGIGTTNAKDRLHLEVSNSNTARFIACLLYTSPSPRDAHESRMPSSA